MKKYLLLALLLVVIILSWCWIQKWDNVECTSWTSWFSWTVIYERWKYIVLNWVEEYYSYWDSGNCPVELDKYWNCVWLSHTTWEWVFHKNEDYCKRIGNYDDMIKNAKKERSRNN